MQFDTFYAHYSFTKNRRSRCQMFMMIYTKSQIFLPMISKFTNHLSSPLFTLILTFCFPSFSHTQIVINEGSNKNYNTLTDEDGDNPDWIELYNAGAAAVNLSGYTLSDNESNPGQWPLPAISMEPGTFLVIYCSGKNRYATQPFSPVANTGVFMPVTGWNNHQFDAPFNWDGSSNIVINVCSYSSTGYITNSVFNQSDVGYPATRFYFEDGSPAACNHFNGYTSNLRPNVKLNGVQIGTDNIQNSTTDYPAPYGNWYYGARHQMLYQANELISAGLTAGNIDSLAFDVVYTDAVTYDYIDFSINYVDVNGLDPYFFPAGGFNYHTNFKIDGEGENIYLFSPGQQLVSSLDVDAGSYNISVGSTPDGVTTTASFSPPTPGATNNQSIPYTDYALAPAFTASSGLYTDPFSVQIINPNGAGSQVYYTVNGSEPDQNSQLYNGNPININQSRVLKAKAFVAGKLPSPVKGASFLFNIEHVTPIISVITANDNLYGSEGIFDNAGYDWLRPAYVEYFAGTETHPLVFSQSAGMQIDGGAGGSRFHPQHSFRVELNNSVLGEGPIDHLVIPNRPDRTTYSDFYLRNGSNQYLILPYKDAAQCRILGNNTNTYYSEWRPVTVYINGEYFGLYELREKFNTEMFDLQDGASPETTEILSLSYYYGSILRAVEGSVDNYWNDHDSANNLDFNAPDFWEQADNYYDLEYYTDYMIGQTWMGNADWPQNNIKIYRSDATDYRWRFCTIDQELALLPNAWTDCNFDALSRLFDIGTSNPFTDIWFKGLQNDRFRNYFINRFADLMNTSFTPDQLVEIENDMYEQTVVEMANEFERWGDAGNVPGQMNEFYNNHLVFQSELLCRSEQVRNHIANHFQLPQQVDLTLEVNPPGAGSIRVSTVIPSTYPWQGVYFDGVPVQIEAFPNEGYEFLYWDANDLIEDTLNAVFNDTLVANATTFTANFEIVTGLPVVNSSSTEFSLYPSLAENEVHIVHQLTGASADLGFQLIDSRGLIIQNGVLNSPSGETLVDIRSLPPAIYFIRIQGNSGVLTNLKFVKTN